MKLSIPKLFLFSAMALVFGLSLPGYAKVAKNDKFPEITLKTLDGKKQFDAKELKGKVVLVDFWASWCEPCKVSLPFLNSLAKKYKGKVVVVGVNVDNEVKDAKGFLKESPAPNVKMVWDAGSTFVKSVGVPTMPSSFLLDKKGTVRVAHQGFREDDKAMIEQEIKKLLKEK